MPGLVFDLDQLHSETLALIEEDQSIMRALNWVDQVLPRFVTACRLSLSRNAASGVETWLDWIGSERALVIEEAGKGEIFRWRLTWLRLLLETTRQLLQNPTHPGSDNEIAAGLWKRYEALSACITASFWADLVGTLRGTNPDAIGPFFAQDARRPVYRVSFPLVLSEPIVDGGSETNVILAEFVLEPAPRFASSVHLHPEQAPLRCMDESFALCFTQAAAIAQQALREADAPLPGVRVRIRTVKPGHERFLHGMVLRGASGAGALAVGLDALYRRRPLEGRVPAISFALCGSRSVNVDGNCHAVGDADDKVRGCARQNVARLLVAVEQQSELALYGFQHGIEIVGAATFQEAVELVGDHRLPAPVAAAPRKIVLTYNRHTPFDHYVSKILEQRLSESGHHVFVDRHLPIGIAWAREIDRQIRAADGVVVLISGASILSDMLAVEVETAYEAQQRQQGRPQLLPIRIGYEGALPERIAHILDPLQQALWQGPEDDDRLIADLERAMQQELGAAEPTDPVRAIQDRDEPDDDLEPFDGPVPLKSRFYVARDADQEFLDAVRRRHGIILIKGPRQVGKSSLLARGLDAAHAMGVKTVLTDFQRLNVNELQSPEAFYRALARMLARQLKLPASIEDLWTPGRSANLNFEEYMEDHVLPHAAPLVWGMDEVDRALVSAPLSSDVFGLFRSWANERQSRPNSPWNGVTMIMAYATEAHLFIKDVHQSPFNIGTRFELRDFTVHEVDDLNQRYGSPLQDDVEVARFYALVGGHPYLVRRGLYSMVQDGFDIDAFESEAVRNRGPIGDHLRRIVTLLARNEDNVAALRDILRGEPRLSYEVFYHLRSAGVIVGDAPEEARPRCQLYTSYLNRHLL